jgi:heat shock protein HslJ
MDGQMEDVDIRAFIRFNKEKKSAGGNGGCNTFGSTLAVKGNTLNISQLFSTKMFCEGVQPVENAFFANLDMVNRFEIKGTTLFLYQDKELLLEFAKTP